MRNGNTRSQSENARPTGSCQKLLAVQEVERKGQPVLSMSRKVGAPARETSSAASAGFATNRTAGDGDVQCVSSAAAPAVVRTSFASLPIAELLKPDGYLARLQARGYTVEAP